MVLVVCERCGTLLAVGLSRCPHCSAPPAEQHEFGSRPEDDEHPMMGRIPGMAKITRHDGPSDATVPAEAGLSEEDAAAVAAMADDEPTTGAPEPEDVLERPGSKANRQSWLEWATAAGYHTPCAEALTVAQIQSLPDGPPVYDDDGLLVAPEDASDETKDAVELYNAKAIDLYEPAWDEAAEAEPGGDDEVLVADEES